MSISLDQALNTSSFDIKTIFGNEIYEKSLRNGIPNYLFLYDCLYQKLIESGADPLSIYTNPLLLKFERTFDNFNRNRQYRMETLLQNSMAQQKQLNEVGEIKDASKFKLLNNATNFVFSHGNSNPFAQQLFIDWTSSLEKNLNIILNDKNVKTKSATYDSNKSQSDNILELPGYSFTSLKKELKRFHYIFSVLDARNLASILALEMTNFTLTSISTNSHENSSSTSTQSLTSVAKSIGESIERAFRQKQIQEVSKKLDTKSNDSANSQIAEIFYRYSSLSPETKKRVFRKSLTMSPADRISLGATFVTLALRFCDFSVKHPNSGKIVRKPAFWHTYKFHKTKMIGVIKINEFLVLEFSRNPPSNSSNLFSTSMLSKAPPMLVKPRPWTSGLSGGYWFSQLSFLSASAGDAPEQYSYINTAMKYNYMDSYLSAFNVLGECAWAINPNILDVILQIWKLGISFLEIPGRLDLKENKNIEMKKLSKDDFNQLCERISLEYIVNTAELFGKNGDRFYFSYKIDFRGRVYPQTNSSFWHMGPDHVRSLFMFWYGKPLGKNGLYWLKIHIATLFGLTKLRHEDRIKFVDDNWENIVQSVQNPLDLQKIKTNSLWWTKADKPFQMLAACFDLVSAVNSGNPESYISRICVAQDGTCNGLQHYSALGRDVQGAVEVNVIPQHRIDSKTTPENTYPRDIYGKVKEIVDDLIEKDTKLTGNDKTVQETKVLAEEIFGKVTRKVVKRPVMTSVYGVTKYGIVQQVLEELKKNPVLNEHNLNSYSRYIGDKITEAYSQLFFNAQKIQSWLEECADRICESIRWDNFENNDFKSSNHSSNHKSGFNKDFLKKFLTSVIWTTPLGLPVVQPYRQPSSLLVRTGIQTLSIVNPFEVSSVKKMKQVNGIAPNFIHSLDSTHMLMTAQAMSGSRDKSQNQIKSFAAVHDSFWTHAADVDEMNNVIREKFVDLHSEDLIQNLYNEFCIRYDGYLQLCYILADSNAGKEITKNRTQNSNFTVDKTGSRLNNEQLSKLELEIDYAKTTLANLKTKEVDLKNSIKIEKDPEIKKQLKYTRKEHEKNIKDIKLKIKDSIHVLKLQKDILSREINVQIPKGKQEDGLLFHEMNQEYFLWYKQKVKGPELNNDESSEKVVTPWEIIQKYKEPVYRYPNIKFPYGDKYSRKKIISTNEQHSESIGDCEVDKEEFNEPLNFHSPDYDTKKWIRVLVPLHIPKIPERGNFDINDVKYSEYFFN